MPPLKSADLYKIAREELEPAMSKMGFKRTPKASAASWCRPEGDQWIVFWFQPRSSNGPFSPGFRFTVEFVMSAEPIVFANGYRARLPELLDDDGREELRRLENRAIGKLPPPNSEFAMSLPAETRDHWLGGWRPRAARYAPKEDVWLMQGDEEDARLLLTFMSRVLPDAIARFVEKAS